jgi:hypothetical protein
MKLIVPVYYHNDDTLVKEDTGIEAPLTEYDIRRVVIFKVDAICPAEDGKYLYTKIWVSGTTFSIPMKPKEVEALVDQAILTGLVDGFKIWKEKQKENA